MKSIKYLLISLILLVLYDSDFPNVFGQLNITDWIFLITFTLFFQYGVYLNANKNK